MVRACTTPVDATRKYEGSLPTPPLLFPHHRLSQDKYTLVEERRSNAEIEDNEVRVTSKQASSQHKYTAYALSLLTTMNCITLKAMGHAINKTVNVAEVVKRRSAGLHQVMGRIAYERGFVCLINPREQLALLIPPLSPCFFPLPLSP